MWCDIRIYRQNINFYSFGCCFLSLFLSPYVSCIFRAHWCSSVSKYNVELSESFCCISPLLSMCEYSQRYYSFNVYFLNCSYSMAIATRTMLISAFVMFFFLFSVIRVTPFQGKYEWCTSFLFNILWVHSATFRCEWKCRFLLLARNVSSIVSLGKKEPNYLLYVILKLVWRFYYYD